MTAATGSGPAHVLHVARAYCGPAHGRTWTVVPDGPPPPLVDVRLDLDPGAPGTPDAETVQYRLVHHPRTRRPVRDHAGSYLYMPVRTVAVGPPASPTTPTQLDVRLPVQQRVRELVVRACDEPTAQSAFGGDASLIR